LDEAIGSMVFPGLTCFINSSANAGERLRLRRLPFALQTGGEAEAGEPHPSVRAVHHDIGRLDVLMDKATLVELA
jgi:hypothetical protein